MKKMRYGNFACEVSVVSDFVLKSQFSCSYEKDTVAYATERFFSKFEKLCRECTYESWQVRIAKGRDRKRRSFEYLIPAVFMELPGDWVQVRGYVDEVGVKVNRVDLLEQIH